MEQQDVEASDQSRNKLAIILVVLGLVIGAVAIGALVVILSLVVLGNQLDQVFDDVASEIELAEP